MLIGAIVLTAVAVLIVCFLVKRASVEPKTWAKRHDVENESHEDAK